MQTVMNLYVVIDTEVNEVADVLTAMTDGQVVRNSLPRYSRLFPTKDIQYYQIGTIDRETGKLEAIERRFVPLDSYKFPDFRNEENQAVGKTQDEVREQFQNNVRDIL